MTAQSSYARWLGLIVAIAFLALLFGLWTHHNTAPVNNPPSLALSNGTVLTPPRSISAFNLLDTSGKPFTAENLQGHWSFIFFGFTHCPQLCPTTLSTLNQMYQQLQTNQQQLLPQIVFISVDPERDTPHDIKQYLISFNSHFLGATGTAVQLEHLTQEFSVMYAKIMQQNGAAHSDEDYTIDHSGTLLLTDPKGQLLAIFSMPHEAKTLAESFKKIVNTYQPQYVSSNSHQG